MTVSGRTYSRDDIVHAEYHRAAGYVLIVFNDGVTVRRDVTATLYV